MVREFCGVVFRFYGVVERFCERRLSRLCAVIRRFRPGDGDYPAKAGVSGAWQGVRTATIFPILSIALKARSARFDGHLYAAFRVGAS